MIAMVRYLLLPALPVVALAQKVNIEFDHSMEFSSVKTFELQPGTINSKAPALNNDIVRKNIENDIRRWLTQRGLTETSSQPDVVVNFSLGSANRREVERYPARWGGWGRRVVVPYTEGTLTIDMRDPRRKELVWRAVAVSDNKDPNKIAAKMDEIVKKAFENFPPKKK